MTDNQLKKDTMVAISSIRRRAHLELMRGNLVEYSKLMADLYELESIIGGFEFPMPASNKNIFTDDVYQEMLDNDEMWFVSSNGTGCNISDAALLDC